MSCDLPAETRNIKRVNVTSTQHYEWGTIEKRYGKVNRAAITHYHFVGPFWSRVVQSMLRANLPTTFLSFYKGAEVDEAARRVTIRGGFARDFVADRHIAFWQAMLRGKPEIVLSGRKHVILPKVAGLEDSLHFFVNGENVDHLAMNSEPDEAGGENSGEPSQGHWYND